jgi:tRNA wybutosine-synthesizing protein 2
MAARPGPVDRVRERISRDCGRGTAAAIPAGYQRLGRVLIVRLPESVRGSFGRIGAAYASELGVETVLRPSGPIEGEYRHPRLERLFGTETETEVREHGSRYRFDAAEVMFARGNKTERARIGALCRSGERVFDLFAGIGYFTIPAARSHPTVRVTAIEANSAAFRYLVENVALNGVGGQVTALRGDNRTLNLPLGQADRVLLGYLPTALPFVPRAIQLLRPEGGALHVHTVVDARGGTRDAIESVRAITGRTGAAITVCEARIVKPYGPGRSHAVVDVRIGIRP